MLRHASRLTLLLLVATQAAPVQSASVRLVGFDELVRASTVVFRGTVTGTRTRLLPRHRSIVTEVEFEVIELYKGTAPTRLVLRVAGGRVDGVGLQAHGLTMPAPGEQGVYFAERLDRPQVNPLDGWDQGYYRVVPAADGTERVLTSRGWPVLRAESAPSPAGIRLSRGVPLGVTADGDAPPAAALPFADFAAAIRAVARTAR